MTPTDCPSDADLADFHAGRLADDRIAAVAEHLDSCARCLAAPAPAGLPATNDRQPTPFDAEAGCRRARQRIGQIAPAGLGAGQILGDFHLIRELGRGGMGVVYEAEQRALGRRVAVKVVQARGGIDPDLMRRFEREAKAVGRLHHTNIVPVFGVGEHDGSPFYAMQLIRGVGLNEVIDALARKANGEPERDALADRLARPLTCRDSAGLIAQAADGVAHAHEQGVLHRDIKPSNLLLDTQGTVWVTDFGLAKTDDAADLTHTGDLLGTVRYMAPEAFDGTTDQRSDVYALGLTLYELLALRPAFDASDRGKMMKAVLDADPAPLRTLVPDLPRDLETVVAKAIDRDPHRRYPTAAALADDLRRFARDEPILARRTGPVERLTRWAKHNRGLAAALAGLAVTLVGVTAGSLLAASRFREVARGEGEQRRLAQAAEDAARSNLYAAEMSLAARVAEQPTGLARLRELVARWVPDDTDRTDPRGWEWRLFRDLARPEAVVRTGRQFYAVAWSPDGTRLAVSVDGTVEVLDPANGTVRSRFPLPGKDAESLCWSADGRRLAVGQQRGGVGVHDPATGAPLYRSAHGTASVTVCLHPGGNWLASHSDDRTVRIHDLAAGTVVAVLPGAFENVPAEFGFSPDGRRLATYQTGRPANRRAVGVWDTADWTLLRTLDGPATDGFTSLGWADDRRLLLTTEKSGTIVWDAETDKPVRQLSADRHLMVSVAASADGRRVAAGDWGRLVWVWDTDTGKPVAVCRGHTERVFRVALAPDGSRVAAVARDGAASALRVWDVSGRRPVRTFDPPIPGTIPRTAGLAWHPTGGRLAGATDADMTGVYNLGGNPTATRRGGQFAWDRTGRRAVSQRQDDVLLFADDRDEPERTLALPGQLKSFAWNPTDDRLAVRVGLHLWVYDPTRPDPPAHVYDDRSFYGRSRYHPCGGVAWHPAGRTLAFPTQGDDGWSVRLIDPSTGTTEATFPAMPLTVWAVKWSPDGSRIAVAGDDPAIKVFDAAGTLVQSLSGHTFTVRDLAYSPDGTRLASAGLDGNVLLWDAKSGRLILSFELGNPVLGVAWSADGTKLAALAETGAVKVWDAGSE